MMNTKIKTAELEGNLLNCWVAIIRGYKIEPYKSGFRMRNEEGSVVGFIGPHSDCSLWNYSPSTDWAQGGEILEEMLSDGLLIVKANYDMGYRTSFDNWETIARGPTPLIAAMRCYVQRNMGEELKEQLE